MLLYSLDQHILARAAGTLTGYVPALTISTSNDKLATLDSADSLATPA